jgi:hypothetical protein
VHAIHQVKGQAAGQDDLHDLQTRARTRVGSGEAAETYDAGQSGVLYLGLGLRAA